MLIVALLPAISFADIYSYVDKDGVAHFTNNPSGDSHYRLYMKSKDGGKRRADAASVAPSDTSVERFSRYGDVIREAATLYQIPEELVRAVIKVESDYDPRAVSRVGAQGLMQLMPETAQRMQVRDILDPRENIFGGVRYLRVLANMFNGDLRAHGRRLQRRRERGRASPGHSPVRRDRRLRGQGPRLLPPLPRDAGSGRRQRRLDRLKS